MLMAALLAGAYSALRYKWSTIYEHIEAGLQRTKALSSFETTLQMVVWACSVLQN